MGIKDIFDEFMTLSYEPVREGPGGDKDTDFGNLIFSRLGRSGYIIHYLYSGASLKVPWKWIDVFGQFFVVGWDRIRHTGVAKNKLEEFIYRMTELQGLIGTKSNTLGKLNQICEIGTKEFREIYPDFLAITYSSKDEDIEI